MVEKIDEPEDVDQNTEQMTTDFLNELQEAGYKERTARAALKAKGYDMDEGKF